MFTLAWGVLNSLFTEQTYKVLLIGLESAGKTTFLEQLKCTYAAPKSAAAGADAEKDDVFPTPAPVDVMRRKRVRRTIGMNLAQLRHRTTPLKVCAASLEGSVRATSANESTASGSVVLTSSTLPEASLTTITTQLILWDVGGSLRSLWVNYFAACHGVIFIVDSTLGSVVDGDTNGNENHMNATTTTTTASVSTAGDVADAAAAVACGSDPSAVSSLPPHVVSASDGTEGSTCEMRAPLFVFPADASGDTDSAPDLEEKRRQLQRSALAENAALLREVFCHPLLADAPLLIVSNKADVEEHCPLADMQEFLGLFEIALMREAYENGAASNRVCSDDSVDKFSGSAPASGRHTTDTSVPGKSGIGNKIMRLAEVSAMSGFGVREAMDWLVLQMRENRRVVVDDV